MTTELDLPNLISRAAKALAEATTAAEVLDARAKAHVALDAATAALRFAKAKKAHDTILAACRQAMADAMVIESQAKIRLADEYDAAQQRGDVAARGGAHGNQYAKVPKENFGTVAADIGLTSKQVFEFRQLARAERDQPGIIRATLDQRVAAGKEPTMADVKRAVEPKPKAGPKPKAAPKPVNTPEFQRRVGELLKADKTVQQIADELGCSIQPVKIAQAAVLKERELREQELIITPDMLSPTAQQKNEAWRRQRERELREEIRTEMFAEVRKWFEELYLPMVTDKTKRAEAILAAQRGLISRGEYRLLLFCVHTDTHANASPEKLNAAFRTLQRIEKVLVKPDPVAPENAPPPLPRSLAEMMALRDKVAAERRAKRKGKVDA